MSGQRARAAGIVVCLILTPNLCSEAQAREGRYPSSRAIGNIDTMSSVVLDRLSVTALRAEKPWDPKICIGCEPRGESSARPRFSRRR